MSTTRGTQSTPVNRRGFLRMAGGAAALATTAGAAGIISTRGGGGGGIAAPRPATNPQLVAYTSGNSVFKELAASDGWAWLPPAPGMAPFHPDVLAAEAQTTYTFGFRDVTSLGGDWTQISQLSGQAQITAPLLYVSEGDDVYFTLYNLGTPQRPDLADGHTIHWHGFPNQIPYFDGVPETSISVPFGREFTYRFIPQEAGTYMYHCHFEDVEHVQLGMTGVVFVRPRLDATPVAPGERYAYNDAGTRFDREFAILLTELDPEEHWNNAHIQTSDWTDYNPQFFLMNGRTFPYTLEPNSDPMTNPVGPLQFQPHSSLIQGNAGDKVLVRLANLGFLTHTLSLPGLPMRVVGRDAKQLTAGRAPAHPGGGARSDVSYTTNHLTLVPGQSLDVIIDMAGAAAGTYPFFNSSVGRLSDGSSTGPGGMRTEVRVHPAGTLPAQTTPNG